MLAGRAGVFPLRPRDWGLGIRVWSGGFWGSLGFKRRPGKNGASFVYHFEMFGDSGLLEISRASVVFALFVQQTIALDCLEPKPQALTPKL